MICTDGIWFKDEVGRTLFLRGVNLGGSSKVPVTPDGATHRLDHFFAHRDISFVGRPFPLSEADEHFRRLRAWGLTFVRFLVTWEAIEHRGPGLYDDEYLDYVRAIVEKAGAYGIRMFIDPHQDVWSRFSGGDGAPGWTLEAVGFDLTKFKDTGAALVHATHGDPLPRMSWPTNATKLAAATMFTLFFGGDDFAPKTRIDGVSVQTYLQDHYLRAMQQLARRLQGLPNVVGYDTMNEPFAGYIGWRDLEAPGGMLRLGSTPTPLQAMALGCGIPQRVGDWTLGVLGMRRTGYRNLNAQGVRAWAPGRECIWHANGVWGTDAKGRPQVLRHEHFSKVGERRVDFARDYYRPFANRYAQAIRDVDPQALIFVEMETGQHPPVWSVNDADRIVFAPHWYDGIVLITKRFLPWLAVDYRTARPVFGRRAIRKSFAAQVGALKTAATEKLGGVPTIIGEFGIPFDLDAKKAYQTGDQRALIRALDRSYQAMDDNLLSCTLWNYTADNTNARGDKWNDEDLSIFSPDQQKDPADIDSGGRALRAVVRPYPRAVAGEPLRMSFHLKRREFHFAFRHDPRVAADTEIFIPTYQYPSGISVAVSDGTYTFDSDAQCLAYRHGKDRDTHFITVSPTTSSNIR